MRESFEKQVIKAMQMNCYGITGRRHDGSIAVWHNHNVVKVFTGQHAKNRAKKWVMMQCA